MTVTPAERLRCAECARAADDQARGWRALHGRDHPEDEPETIIFCAQCAQREFGLQRVVRGGSYDEPLEPRDPARQDE